LKEKAIILDIDGTLADVEHRRHFVEGKLKDWKSFFESMVTDTPNQWCVDIINAFRETHTILLVTGRGDDYAEHTKEWLSEHKIHFDFIFMRPAGNFDPDDEIKEAIYRKHIEEFYDVNFIVDDRQKVVDKWRALGLVCLQCDLGDF